MSRKTILRIIEGLFRVLAFCGVLWALSLGILGIAWLVGVFA